LTLTMLSAHGHAPWPLGRVGSDAPPRSTRRCCVARSQRIGAAATECGAPIAALEREGRLTGYLSAATFWLTNHGVAETELDMRALLAGAGALIAEPLSLLLPTRQANLFRWCLHQGMRANKPMTLMTMGQYQEPEGCYFPSVLY
jgi:hypothetical protein